MVEDEDKGDRNYKYQQILDKYNFTDYHSPLMQFLLFSKFDFPRELTRMPAEIVKEITGVHKSDINQMPMGLRRKEARMLEKRMTSKKKNAS